jgi:hypothetical protein
MSELKITRAEATALNLALSDLARRLGEDRIGAVLRTSGALLGDGGVVSLLAKLDLHQLSKDEIRKQIKIELSIDD